MQHLHIVKTIIIKKQYLKTRHLRLNITSSTKKELFLGTLWYMHPSRGRITVFFQSAGFIGSSHLQLFLQLCSLASKTLQALPLLLTSIAGLRLCTGDESRNNHAKCVGEGTWLWFQEWDVQKHAIHHPFCLRLATTSLVHLCLVWHLVWHATPHLRSLVSLAQAQHIPGNDIGSTGLCAAALQWQEILTICTTLNEAIESIMHLILPTVEIGIQ